MMYRISKEFHFSAAHHLAGLPEEHPCARPHGHNYTVILTLENVTLDAAGMVVDYGNLADFGRMINVCLDHRDLNEVFVFNPTAENLARHLFTLARLYEWGKFVRAVTVKETEKTAATYEDYL